MREIGRSRKPRGRAGGVASAASQASAKPGTRVRQT